MQILNGWSEEVQDACSADFVEILLNPFESKEEVHDEVSYVEFCLIIHMQVNFENLLTNYHSLIIAKELSLNMILQLMDTIAEDKKHGGH